MSRFIDFGRLTGPDFSHCPYCSRCVDTVGHCDGDDCAPDWKSGADNRKPDAHCACDCERCLHPWAAKCDNSAEHKWCAHHGRED